MVPFTVALMYHLIQIGDPSAFSPSGTEVAFVVKRPLETERNFARTFLQNDDVADVYVADLQRDRITQITDGAVDGSGFWDPQWSPDGKRIAMLSTRGDNVYLWVWDSSVGLHRVTDRAIDLASFQWLSNERIICQVLPAGQQPLSMSVETQTPEIAMHEWPIDWRGRETTANVLQSGVPANVARLPQGEIRIVDLGSASEREQTVAHAAHFESLTLSHDGRDVAVFLETGILEPRNGRKLQSSFDNGEYALSVFDTKTGRAIRHLDRRVIGDAPISWSTDDREIAILGQPAATAYTQHLQIFRCEVANGACTGVLPSSLDIDTGPNGMKTAPLWASDGRILAYARTSGKASGSTQQRWDWYAISSQGRVTNLTGSLNVAPPTLAPIDGWQRFVGLAAGKLVAVFPDGRAPKPIEIAHLPKLTGIAWPTKTDVAVRELVATAEGAGRNEFLAIDMASGEIARLGRVSPDTTLNAFDQRGSSALFVENARDGSFLRYAGRGEPLRTLYAANRWLSHVAAGRCVAYSYTSIDGHKLSAWLLLPPGYKAGRRYPAVVWVYGGSVMSPKTIPYLAHLNLAHALNLQLLAAHGYAVIFPSMPLPPFGQPSDPYPKLPNGVLPAIDKAAQLGYIDPNRVAVMGQSYGGFSTYALITQTDRFKAAVALAGVSDWTSLYGMYDGRQRYSDNVNVNDEFNQILMEDGQGNFGVPPWVNPQRYTSNSPLTYVARVRTPLLIIQGDLDFVSIQQGEEFFTALYRQGKRAEFARYWGEEHVFRSEANIKDCWNRIVGWLNEFLR